MIVANSIAPVFRPTGWSAGVQSMVEQTVGDWVKRENHHNPIAVWVIDKHLRMLYAGMIIGLLRKNNESGSTQHHFFCV